MGGVCGGRWEHREGGLREERGEGIRRRNVEARWGGMWDQGREGRMWEKCEGGMR